jgi:hypothetical protein
MRPSPPVRFLAITVGGWVCLRAALLTPGWLQDPPNHRRALPQRPPVVTSTPSTAAPMIVPVAAHNPAWRHVPEGPTSRRRFSIRPPAPLLVPAAPAAPKSPPPPARLASAPAPAPALPITAPRWSVSAWLFVREGDGGSILPGGTLGGSQAGARIGYRINRDASRPISLSGRLYAPLDNAGAAEFGAGLDWKPLAGLPLHLLAERRQALGKDGRSAFALIAYGGVSDEPIGPLRLDAYAQAGLVGIRSRDMFVDGSARVGIPIGPARLGAGAWGAAQPGVARLDAGPHVSVRLPVKGANILVGVDWRLRVAGEAAPRSGPALTLATDF